MVGDQGLKGLGVVGGYRLKGSKSGRVSGGKWSLEW